MVTQTYEFLLYCQNILFAVSLISCQESLAPVSST